VVVFLLMQTLGLKGSDVFLFLLWANSNEIIPVEW
jgi:hypothetical protein